MDNWVRTGAEPPASVYPKVAQLTTPAGVKFPKIPGVNFPLHPTTAYRLDFSVVPPKVGEAFPALVPQCDDDGIDLGGIRMPEVAAPLATYTGWNLRSAKIGAPEQLFSMQGSWVPFPIDKAQRAAMHDPRASIEERYPTRDGYLVLVRASAMQLVKDGFLLEGDVGPVVEHSEAEWAYVHGKGKEISKDQRR
jgi:hypothetical protein